MSPARSRNQPAALWQRFFNALSRDRAASRLAAAAFLRILMGLIGARRLRLAAALINAWQGRPGFFSLELAPGEPSGISAVRIRLEGGECRLGLNQYLPDSPRLEFMTRRLVGSLPLLSVCRGLPDGETWLNLDDFGVKPGLAFCAAGPEHFLVPDPIYLAERGYRRTAETYLRRGPSWADRKPVAFWRGSTTGRCAPGEWRTLDRARLCAIAASHPGLFDVGFGGLAQVTPEDADAIRRSGLMRPPVPEADFVLYRYQIDIDGNSNSWQGLFGKLLTGSPVMKVASARGFRQWYYDRLIPWVNFVPVAADMSDLVEKVGWLKGHDTEAQRIGAAGQALALSMTQPMELRLARATVKVALAEKPYDEHEQ